MKNKNGKEVDILAGIFIDMLSGIIMVGFLAIVFYVFVFFCEPKLGYKKSIDVFMFILSVPTMIAGAYIGRKLVKVLFRLN